MRNAIVNIGTDARGNYRKEIGFEMKPSGQIGPHKFYFGMDRSQAAIRCLNVQACWGSVEKRWATTKAGNRPLWDRLTVGIAKAVASGLRDHGIDPADCPFDFSLIQSPEKYSPEAHKIIRSIEGLPTGKDVLTWLAALQNDFPMVRLHVEGEPGQKVQGAVKAKAAEYRKLAEEREVLTQSDKKLHEALDAFAEWTRKQHQEKGQPSEYAMGCCRQITNIKENSKNVPLSSFGLTAIEDMLTTWKNRPMTKKGKPCSVDHAKNCISRVRQFLRWLNSREEFMWDLPKKYTVTPIRVDKSQAERASKFSPTQVKSYTVEELTTLYHYATPRLRLMMLLGLNCGFGRAEVGTLQIESEIFLDQEHGHYPGLVGSWIKRLRGKTDVYGEFKLWPETMAGLRWYLSRRPETAETCLLVRKGGKPLIARTSSGNRGGAIANEWASLTAKVQADDRYFRKLSFNKLRKTGATMIRKASDGETSGVFLCHGSAVKSDSLADLYADRDFTKVFDALDKVHVKLAPMFEKVAEPFPLAMKKTNPSLSLGVRDQIVSLRKEGKWYDEIAAILSISKDTIRRYLRASGMTRTYTRKKK